MNYLQPTISTFLVRSDLMELEAYLAAFLKQVLPFSSHSLYFPTAHNAPVTPQWLSRERTLLLPLCQGGVVLGVFMARGVDGRTVRRLLPSLPAITELCLTHLSSIQYSRMDALTGLARMHQLLMRMEHDAEMVRTRFMGSDDTEHHAPLHKACMGLIVVRCPALESLALEFGHVFADTVLVSLAKAIKAELPSEVLAARSGENECTLLLPSATRTSCSNLTYTIMKCLENVTVTHAPTARTVRPHCVAGYALYPQDMENRRMGLSMAEQSRHLLHKARLAAEVAYERSLFLSAQHKATLEARCMAYARILAQGGVIQEVLPLGHATVNLGRRVGAREGQRFSVWGVRKDGAELKGEIVLTKVRDAQSVAETLHLKDAAWTWEEGDSLVLAEEKTSASSQVVKQESAQVLDGILSYNAFLQELAQANTSQTSFTLALVRLHTAHDADVYTDMQHLVELCHHAHSAPPTQPFGGQGQRDSYAGLPTLCGSYGETSLIFFHSATTAVALQPLYASIVEKAYAEQKSVAVGLASYPYLQFNKGDILECCHKALDLALLLPAPQVGIMGSLALNISADQHYSRGDVFVAIEEYKLSLLADADNAMAWNSLGVCMAALARHSEARYYFREALKRWKKDTVVNDDASQYVGTLYNLGTVCQSLGEKRAAARYFRQCIQADDTHAFAYIRLGQLAEQAERYTQARQHYTKVAQLEEQGKGQGSLAQRHLARVALRQQKNAEARELLHEALLRNPQDAASLCMLAELYLASGEDPAMSEMLARKSVGLRPEHAPSWRLLAKILRVLGREDAALNAEDKAATL